MNPVPRFSFGLVALSTVAGLVTAVAAQTVEGQEPERAGVRLAMNDHRTPLRPPPGPAIVIAHRGASAYAPEHTLAAYELAIEQGADFIEPDVQVTRDGHLVAIHDETLERTTDVEELYPFRFREVPDADGEVVRRWYVRDFTLAELKLLDAGSWFGPSFAGARIPTFDEVLELARGRAGVFPETKFPDVYAHVGHDMERLLVEALERHGLAEPGAEPRTPVIVQSFSAESLRRLRHEVGSTLPSAFLLSGRDADDWLSDDGLTEIEGFATGIGPTKRLLLEDPSIVSRAHDHGLTVVPWTFRASNPGAFDSVADEMAHFLCTLGVDGLFTDNPDVFASAALCRGLE